MFFGRGALKAPQVWSGPGNDFCGSHATDSRRNPPELPPLWTPKVDGKPHSRETVGLLTTVVDEGSARSSWRTRPSVTGWWIDLVASRTHDTGDGGKGDKTTKRPVTRASSATPHHHAGGPNPPLCADSCLCPSLSQISSFGEVTRARLLELCGRNRAPLARREVRCEGPSCCAWSSWGSRRGLTSP